MITKIQTILLLAVALALSVGINVAQFLAKYRADIEAPLVQEIEDRKQVDRVNAAVSKARVADQRTIADLRRRIGERQVETVTVYRDRVRTLPAPSCAPGASRVAVWNSLATEDPR